LSNSPVDADELIYSLCPFLLVAREQYFPSQARFPGDQTIRDRGSMPLALASYSFTAISFALYLLSEQVSY
jgi:hypothetical protein